MAYQLICPCGRNITSLSDEFVGDVQAHLAAEHPGRNYSADDIMSMAMEVSDKLVTPKS
ncbi:hypothetical protein GOARA_004_00200 [Gordonia araii NBRC 100433]|uniref:DUF1059 domain-containing protein n=1 Tax=Gordonia araii NBRC 100433 TaxID=1073574 RepID=G7GX55_9ACTN|nr:hypothetical protein [Gordonia araii]NNG98189.1 hypothetical protein [Gordonia araii NBRC 100433]GAB08180.1 hypothetical protein GOARA_004_00200 [Gordonia araii NBRC 100433]